MEHGGQVGTKKTAQKKYAKIFVPKVLPLIYGFGNIFGGFAQQDAYHPR
jgi:hypothetical protein